MKIVLNILAIAAIIGAFALASGKIYSTNTDNDVEPLLSCLWFPYCKDPDFQLQQENKSNSNEVQNDLIDIESLYACLWFPYCKDPDQPFADEVTTAELV